MVTGLIFLLILLVVLLWGRTSDRGDRVGDGSPTGDLAAMQGTWRVSKLDHQCAQGERDDELIASTEFTVKGDAVKAKIDPREPAYLAIRLDSSRFLKEIDFLRADENGTPDPSNRAKGIYKFESGMIVLAVAIDNNADRPTEFRSLPPKNPRAELGGVVVIYLRKK